MEKINIIPHSIEDMSYRQLQKLCKYYGLPANLKREELLGQLIDIEKYERELFSINKQKEISND